MNSINVEIVVKNECIIQEFAIIERCKKFLSFNNAAPGIISKFSDDNDIVMALEIDYIIVATNSYSDQPINYHSPDIKWYVYRLDKTGPQDEESLTLHDDNTLHLASYTVLPSASLFGLWENLIYEENLKEDLLSFVHTVMQFAEKGVNANIISCNKVILLHGPPGTGKTSLCKAIAQKLSIRLKDRYKQGILIEINSHSLFSKYFSESGKLVTQMFNKIKDAVESTKSLVCVLIDEVESLTIARNQCLSGNEPSDALKVVNAVLTQIDQIREYPNVIILTTSNMTGAIDLAFVDRADIKKFVGLPTSRAIFEIYKSCLYELLKTNLIHYNGTIQDINESTKLRELTEESKGLSGRMLRKIPFIAHALFNLNKLCSLEEFVDSMRKAVSYEMNQRELFKNNHLLNC